MNSERTTFLAIVTVALLAALVVAPAAARDVMAGSTIFVGEENLNLTVINGTPVATLVYYSTVAPVTIGRTISVGDPDAFELTMVDVWPSIGTWYAFPAGAALDDPGAASGHVIVQVPSTQLNVKIAGTPLDVNGQTVPQTEGIQFELLHNLGSLAPAPVMEIEVTAPDGDTVRVFGSNNVDLGNVALTGETYTSPAIGLAGVEAGTYTARAVWPNAADFYGKGYDSNAVTFEVISGTLGITASRSSVTYGYDFVVTITGEPGTTYCLYIEDAGLPAIEYPWIPANQVGVTLTTAPDGSPVAANVTTSAAGRRSVLFDTNKSTDERAFTIRVEDPADATICDEVMVRVKQGDVTITASGTGTYFIGEEIVVSGTNTDSNTVYLFLTGPNLPANGVRLDGGMSPVESNNAASFTSTSVAADEIWVYRWDTGGIARSLDAGGYTIYAVSEPRSKGNLVDVKYDTQTIQLRPPTLSAQPSSLVLAPGDELVISGVATGNTPCVNIWVFGKNYYGGADGALGVDVVSVEPDGTFAYVLMESDTYDLYGGEYYVVVQHPVGPQFGVAPGIAPLGQNPNSIYRADQTGMTNVFVADLTRLQASEAVNALTDALESPYVDDIYAKFSFTVMDEFWIRIDPISDQTYGEFFTVAGATDYPAGTVLHYWIVTKEANACVLSGEATVVDDGGWSIDLDTTEIGPGAFTLQVTAPGGLASAAAVFDVYDEFTHPIPPAGATYRVERISVNPSFDDLASGAEVTLDGTIRAPWAGQHGNLEFSTDLKNPAWSCTLERDRVAIYTKSGNSGSITLTPFELDYGQEIMICLSLSGTVPQGIEDPALLRILEREADGRVVPHSEHLLSIPLTGDAPTPPITGTLTLSPGWNFISIPRPLAAGNDTAAIFAGVDADGHSAFRYDTANGTWMNLTKTGRLAPLEGYWIYSAGPATVPLNFSTDPLVSPAERALAAGWNAVGITGSTPATARDAFHSVKGQWSNLIGYNAGAQTFETGIVNSGTGANADTRPVYPGRGYWLSMTGPGTLYAIGA